MKLYATITSERASKGQGGKYIDVLVVDEKREPILTLNVSPSLYRLNEYREGRPHTVYEGVPTKGKREKGEKLTDICSNCGDKCHLLADMIGENGTEIHLCENCLRDSE